MKNITFISAGAGSGKTYRLTELLLEKLNNNSVRPSGVLATTFTVKAANELKERVRGFLLENNRWELAQAIEQARIGTVNSVCDHLVRRFAFEIGLATDLRVLTETQAQHLLDTSVEMVIDSKTRVEIRELAQRLSYDDSQSEYNYWLKVLRSLLQAIRINDIDVSELPVMAEQSIQGLLQYFGAPTTEDLNANLKIAIETALQAIAIEQERKFTKTTDSVQKDLEIMLQKLKANELSWRDWVVLSKVTAAAGLREAMAELNTVAAEFVNHPQLHEDITRFITLLFELAAKALHLFCESKREEGVLDFVDQEHLLLKALDNPTICDALKDELDLLIVDEFQDTSPIQLAIFSKLAELTKESYWVGDIKQAIYGFRDSDSELMDQVIAELTAQGASFDTLKNSYRSRPPLVDLVNDVFVNVFKHLPPERVTLSATRDDILNEPSFQHWFLEGSNKNIRYASLAAGIRENIESNLSVFDKKFNQKRAIRYSDIAILVRSNDNITELTKILSTNGIPVASSRTGLLNTPEAALSLACLRRFLYAKDSLATAEILTLADSQSVEDWLPDRIAYVENLNNESDNWLESGENPHPIILKLASLRSEAIVLSPKEAIERIIALCDLPSIVVKWHADSEKMRERLGNLQQLISLAEQYEDECKSSHQAASVSGLLLWLYDLANSELDEMAEPDTDSVRVLTYHGAKGLEWPMVICMDLDGEVKSRFWGVTTLKANQFDFTIPLKNRSIRFYPWPFGTQKIVPAMAHIDESPDAKATLDLAVSEIQRLLYVAMTRARDYLIFTTHKKDSGNGLLSTLSTDYLTAKESEETEEAEGTGYRTLQLSNGKTISYQYRTFSDTEENQTRVHTPMRWFTPVNHIALTKKLPRYITPSTLESEAAITARIVEEDSFAERIKICITEDTTDFGTTIHHCLAFALTQTEDVVTPDRISDILLRWNMNAFIKADDISTQVLKIRSWLNKRWRDAKWHVEVPITQQSENGQIMNGQIDLLLETNAGWILFDHKSNPQKSSEHQKLADEYITQLNTYADSLTALTGKSVLGKWLILPITGKAIRVS